MKYQVVRETIKSGDILFWSSPGLFSTIIKKFTKSRYTHVGLAWVVGGRVLVLEAMPGNGIRIFPLSNATPFYLARQDVVKWNDELEKFALEKVGEKYSFIEAIRGFFGITVVDNKWECAEYVQAILGMVDKNIFNIHPTPANIHNYAVLNYGTVVQFIEN